MTASCVLINCSLRQQLLFLRIITHRGIEFYYFQLLLPFHIPFRLLKIKRRRSEILLSKLNSLFLIYNLGISLAPRYTFASKADGNFLSIYKLLISPSTIRDKRPCTL